MVAGTRGAGWVPQLMSVLVALSVVSCRWIAGAARSKPGTMQRTLHLELASTPLRLCTIIPHRVPIKRHGWSAGPVEGVVA